MTTPDTAGPETTRPGPPPSLHPRPAPPALARLDASPSLRAATTALTLWRARRNLLHMFHPGVGALPWRMERLAGLRLVTVNDAGLARHILATRASSYGKGPLYQALLGDVLGSGSLLLEGEASRQRRRLIGPAFSAKALARVEGVVARRTAATVAGWEEAARVGRPVDLSADCLRLTMDIAMEAFFGAELGPRAKPLAETLDRLLIEASTASLADLMGLPAWAPRRSRARVSAMVLEIDRVLNGVIDARLGAPGGQGDLLDALLGARDPETGAALSRREVRDEVMTLFMAGHETTALSLSWGLDRLAREPATQARLAETDEPAALARAYEEILRLYPPAYALAREAREDDRYEGPSGALDVRAGDRFQIPIFMLHRNCDWPAPDAFAPERFRVPPPPAFMPFGAGPRACVGMALARMEGRALLSAALPRLVFTPAGPPPEAVGRVTLRTRAPVRARVSLRRAPS